MMKTLVSLRMLLVLMLASLVKTRLKKEIYAITTRSNRLTR